MPQGEPHHQGPFRWPIDCWLSGAFVKGEARVGVLLPLPMVVVGDPPGGSVAVLLRLQLVVVAPRVGSACG